MNPGATSHATGNIKRSRVDLAYQYLDSGDILEVIDSINLYHGFPSGRITVLSTGDRLLVERKVDSSFLYVNHWGTFGFIYRDDYHHIYLLE